MTAEEISSTWALGTCFSFFFALFAEMGVRRGVTTVLLWPIVLAIYLVRGLNDILEDA